jgi:hypothetical protein
MERSISVPNSPTYSVTVVPETVGHGQSEPDWILNLRVPLETAKPLYRTMIIRSPRGPLLSLFDRRDARSSRQNARTLELDNLELTFKRIEQTRTQCWV